ncbi:Mov34/MPN/PAD-1 family protein [Sphingomonas oryzagri]|uniref:Mov34/MPN/PAD-1 family protein n=1 Tax=Sphingomonas oryzagri TaxID=3042314 RepID=UPI0036F39807
MTVRLLFDRTVRASLIRFHARATHRLESGGLLLGYRKGSDLHVVDATFPSRWDRATRTMFHRSAIDHRRKAFKAWRTSSGTIDWIGEWHTHPGGTARPSSIDLRSWATITIRRRAPMVFMILDDQGQYLGLQTDRTLRQFNRVLEESVTAILFGLST